ncbi:MAG: hypothetical protein JWR50_2113 [Mucilaginibacter sp.]|nr:hypothetical protein [Mucilaginibacter sp.]
MNLSLEQKLHYTLRLAVAMCFIGHGAFGIITKPIWCNYFAVIGIGKTMAYQLMPVLGTIDILLGIIMLVYPLRAIALWLVIWGVVTASLRPLSGEPFAELIERAGNFGAPLALILLSGGIGHFRELFKPINPSIKIDESTLANVTTCLRVIVFLLLAGHGWLNIIGKKGLLTQYTNLGFANPLQVAHIVGVFEIAAAFIILIRPLRSVLFIVLIWKIASELFYPHYMAFEWIERGGSYCTLLALWFISEKVAINTLFANPRLNFHRTEAN